MIKKLPLSMEDKVIGTAKNMPGKKVKVYQIL